MGVSVFERKTSVGGFPNSNRGSRLDDGITFAVDDVSPAPEKIPLGTLKQSFDQLCRARILLMPEQEVSAIIISSDVHPLIQAVHLAFSQHRPLILSPDAIWLVIVQGFGHHVLKHAEELRGRIVNHQGKKRLNITTYAITPESWPAFIAYFSELIKANSDPFLHETLMCNFTTTTPSIKTAYEIALMDAYQQYFEYSMACICGIPEITVTGTPEDWRRMQERIEVLATYDLQWWTSKLAPILDEFIMAAEGKPDRDFWKAIYKPEKFYATESATGWIADLFPYLFSKEDERLLPMRNLILGTQRVNWLPAKAGEEEQIRINQELRRSYETRTDPDPSIVRCSAVALDSFPTGISSAPLHVTLPDKSETDVAVMGGFLGVSQRDEDNALAPIISWAVAKPEAASARR